VVLRAQSFTGDGDEGTDARCVVVGGDSGGVRGALEAGGHLQRIKRAHALVEALQRVKLLRSAYGEAGKRNEQSSGAGAWR